MTCPKNPHVHGPTRPMFLPFAYGISLGGDENEPWAALCMSPTIADRIAMLLERHGLVDVPDTVAAIAPFPPPTGLPAPLPTPTSTGDTP